MKIIVVTPAGRKRHLNVLYHNLKRQRDDFHEWHLWVNTIDAQDIAFCKHLESTNDWIKTYDLTVPYEGMLSISSFFQFAKEPNTIYVRLDDDIVYVENGAIKELAQHRAENKKPFLVYGNILNNALVDHVIQRFGGFNISTPIEYMCMGQAAWLRGDIAEERHRCFLNGKVHNPIFGTEWELYSYERCSINVISWFGEDFAAFTCVDKDEEQWLSCVKSAELSRPNIIFFGKQFVHYAFHTQRDYLNSRGLLHEYEKLIE